MTLETLRTGTWWSPTNPTLRVGGTLQRSEEQGYEPELHGSPDDIHALGEDTIEGIPLLGEDPKGLPITV